MANSRKKEAFFIQTPVPDGSVEFHDATSYVGRAMPFKKPKATCGMRVSGDTVAFTLLHLTKKTASTFAQKDVQLPRGPLVRLEKRAAELSDQLSPGQVYIETDEHTHVCQLITDDNGVADLEPIGDDIHFDLPRSAVRLSLYLPVEALGRTIAVGFIGHPGKPGSPSTIRRVAAMALYSLSQLSQFRVLTDIETVDVPAPPRGVMPLTRTPDERVIVPLPVWFFSDDNPPNLLASGEVTVEVDLTSANHTTSRLLYHFTPDEQVAELFPAYRNVLESTITSVLKAELGEEALRLLTIDIVLGEIGSGDVERIRSGFEPITGGLDLTTSLYQVHQHQ